MEIPVFVCEKVHEYLDLCLPTIRKAMNHLFIQFEQGFWPRKVRNFRLPLPGIPQVFETTPFRQVRVYFSIVGKSDHWQVFFWGVKEQKESVYVNHFSYGGPWLSGEYSLNYTLPELDFTKLESLELPAEATYLANYGPWVLKSRTPLEGERAAVGQTYKTPPALQNFVAEAEYQWSKLAGASVARPSFEMHTRGFMPVVFQARGAEELHALIASLGPNDVVVVEDREAAEGWRTKFDETLFFAANDALDRVYNRALLIGLLRPTGLATTAEKIRQELFLLERFTRVLRRVRQTVIVCEDSITEHVFHDESFKGRVFHTSDLSHVQLILSGPEHRTKWSQLGYQYAGGECLNAAAMCFGWAGDDRGFGIAEGKILASKGLFLEAGLKFLSIDDWESAAWNLELAGQLREANRYWRKAKNQKGILRTRICMYKLDGKWKQAAQLYERDKDWENALKAHVRSGSPERAAKISVQKLKDPVRALELYREGKCYGQAASLLEKMERFVEAIYYYQRAKDSRGTQRLLARNRLRSNLGRFYLLEQNEEKYLAYLEGQRDILGCLEILSKRDTANLLVEAKLLRDKRDNFRAYVRFLVAKDWLNAGNLANVLGLYEEAAAAFHNGTYHYEEGIAYMRLGKYKEALTRFLETDQDLPDFTRSRRALPKIKDRNWLIELVDKLIERKAYQQAAWLCTRLALKLRLGIVRMCEGRHAEAISIWTKLESAAAYNRACEICLELGRITEGAELVTVMDPCYPEWHRGLINVENTPAIFEVTMRHFKESPDLINCLKWVGRIRERDRFGKNVHMTFLLFELCKDIDSCVKLILRWHSTNVFDTLLAGLRSDSDTQEGQPAFLAIRYFCLKRMSDFKKVLESIPFDRECAPIFLLKWDNLAMLKNYLSIEVDGWDSQMTPDADPRLIEVAEQAQKSGAPYVAGLCYALAGKYDLAIPCLSASDEVIILGDIHFWLGHYAEALSCYREAVEKPFIVMAKSYEQMKCYRKAARYYRLAGELKIARRMLSRKE